MLNPYRYDLWLTSDYSTNAKQKKNIMKNNVSQKLSIVQTLRCPAMIFLAIRSKGPLMPTVVPHLYHLISRIGVCGISMELDHLHFQLNDLTMRLFFWLVTFSLPSSPALHSLRRIKMAAHSTRSNDTYITLLPTLSSRNKQR